MERNAYLIASRFLNTVTDILFNTSHNPHILVAALLFAWCYIAHVETHLTLHLSKSLLRRFCVISLSGSKVRALNLVLWLIALSVPKLPWSMEKPKPQLSLSAHINVAVASSVAGLPKRYSCGKHIYQKLSAKTKICMTFFSPRIFLIQHYCLQCSLKIKIEFWCA